MYYNLEEFPGCCGIVVLHDTCELPDANVKERMAAIKSACLEAFNSRYRYIMAADVSQVMFKTYEAAGFTELARFTNAKTNRVIRSYGKKLTRANVR